jgi:hypothetical protein
LEQYDAESEDLQRHPVHLVDKRTSLGFEESLEGTLLKAMGMIVTGPLNVAIAQIYNDHGPRGLHDSSPVMSNDTEGACARSPAKSLKPEEHFQLVRYVLTTLCGKNLRIKPEKTEFHKQYVKR